METGTKEEGVRKGKGKGGREQESEGGERISTLLTSRFSPIYCGLLGIKTQEPEKQYMSADEFYYTIIEDGVSIDGLGLL